ASFRGQDLADAAAARLAAGRADTTLRRRRARALRLADRDLPVLRVHDVRRLLLPWRTVRDRQHQFRRADAGPGARAGRARFPGRADGESPRTRGMAAATAGTDP